jgi:hypothetical protein
MGGWLYALAQVIQDLGCLAWINATMSQCQDDFIVGTLVGHQPGGQLDIRLQYVVCHACAELLYRQTSPDTSQHL